MKETNDKRLIEMNIADAIMEKPISFKVGSRQFFIYPPTLGKTYLLSRLIDAINVDNSILSINPYIECYRLASNCKETVCRIIAYHSLKTKKEIQDEQKVSRRAKVFETHLNVEELAQILVLSFTIENVSSYISYLGIDDEQKRRARVMMIKKNSNNMSFGGKSTYGTIIDWACQRYGWTMDYVVWGISYANLQMLMADSITSIYLSDEEMKKVGFRDDRDVINADDPNNRELIKQMINGI